MIFREIDWRPPLDAFAPFAGEPFAALLHAGEGADDPGWSVLAAFPAKRLEARGGVSFLNGEETGLAPVEALRVLHLRRTARRADFAATGDAPNFASGLVGFIGYEIGASLEPTAAGPASPFALPDLAFGAYDACALFDRARRRAFICAFDSSEGERLEEALGKEALPALMPLGFGAVRSNFAAEDYRRAVGEAVERIRSGGYFQVNLAQHLSADSAHLAPAFEIFRRVAAGDAPFAALLQYKEGAIVSNSPERFFGIERLGDLSRIVAEPVKGTRPRSSDPPADRRLAAALLGDAKERAENIMIADLTRNDLSRICRDGSIEEEAICALQSHAHVHHLVSRISGMLRDGLGPVDAMAALFPCGSITGAPKIEAMKDIAAIEGIGRGPYCGAIGYIDDRGFADFAVAIRTMIVTPTERGSRATFPVGGGITLRSDPEAEYQETLIKARGSLEALGIKESHF